MFPKAKIKYKNKNKMLSLPYVIKTLLLAFFFEDSKLFSRYMDDIIRDIKKEKADQMLAEINTYHPFLKFTMERESDGSIPFLDMKIINSDGLLSSTWYRKPTDTGITMNFHAMAPTKYKRTVVSGLVHRVYRACSSWNNFHESLVKAKKLLDDNQYPEKFYEPIIRNSINKIIERNRTDINEQVTEPKPEEKENELKNIFVQYRGKGTDKFIESLNRLNAPCKVISTIKKLKTILPPLKAATEKSLKSKVVYHIKCSRCDACYVGQTARHLITRFNEHTRNGPVASHIKSCNRVTMENVTILARTNRSITHLMTLEALHIKAIKPNLNTKDEYKSRTLTIKL